MPTPDFKPYVDLFAALLTPTIGITTAWIAIQQYRLAKERMRRELYDRRLAVYRGVIEVLSAGLIWGCVRGEELAMWAKATAEKGFLFDARLCQYLEEIRKRAVEAWALNLQLNGGQLPAGDRRAEIAGKHGDALQWLSEQLPEMQNRFAKYLRVV
jgi:hypothetical protein